jgi:predicted ATPase
VSTEDLLQKMSAIMESKFDEAMAEALEEKKMDPVGKADSDIDNDGDVDDSDEYLKKRRAAIGKAIKQQKEAREEEGEHDGEEEMAAEMKKLHASGCGKHEMYAKMKEKYGCDKKTFEGLYASNCSGH